MISSGQISIMPKPELRGFWGSSLIKPPFRVTSADVAIICPDIIHLPLFFVFFLTFGYWFESLWNHHSLFGGANCYPDAPCMVYLPTWMVDFYGPESPFGPNELPFATVRIGNPWWIGSSPKPTTKTTACLGETGRLPGYALYIQDECQLLGGSSHDLDTWLITMVGKSPKDPVVGPLPNGLNGLSLNIQTPP